jgi:hypothetical protein
VRACCVFITYFFSHLFSTILAFFFCSLSGGNSYISESRLGIADHSSQVSWRGGAGEEEDEMDVAKLGLVLSAALRSMTKKKAWRVDTVPCCTIGRPLVGGRRTTLLVVVEVVVVVEY